MRNTLLNAAVNNVMSACVVMATSPVYVGHVTPLPENPALHAHVNEPTVLVHWPPTAAQLCV
jgi:hypothetical protein